MVYQLATLFVALLAGQQIPAQDLRVTPIEKGDGAYLGVYLGDVDEERAKTLQLTEARGAIVGTVDEGSPAARAGLQANDVILSFNDKKVLNRAQFFIMLIEAGPGSRITLGIARQGQTQTIAVELGSRRLTAPVEPRPVSGEPGRLTAALEKADKPEEYQVSAPGKDALESLRTQKNLAPVSDRVRGLKMGSAGRFYLGINTAALSEQLARYFQVIGGGVLVTEITTGSLAERAGVKAGDCIIKVNDDSVSSVSDFNALVERLIRDRAANKAALECSLAIVREGKEQKINLKSDLK